jgi:hypothetical protein
MKEVALDAIDPAIANLIPTLDESTMRNQIDSSKLMAGDDVQFNPPASDK